jgi:hypothetical protein
MTRTLAIRAGDCLDLGDAAPDMALERRDLATA